MAEKHVLICSKPLATREMQIQTTARFPPSDWLKLKKRKQQRMTNAGENIGKEKHLFTADGSANWHSHGGNWCGGSSENYKGPATWLSQAPHGHIPSGFCVLHRETCWFVFTAAPFTIARKWRQPRYPSSDEWILAMWNICTIQHYSAVEGEKKRLWNLQVNRWNWKQSWAR